MHPTATDMDTGEDVAVKFEDPKNSTLDEEAFFMNNSLGDTVFPPSICVARKQGTNLR